jgi:tetratricopeptide (TPR) repeat protein
MRLISKIGLVAILMFCGCSTRKNTIISRSYHSLTAKYNVLFNGNESFKKGIARYNAAYKDDYSRILPVFNYGDKEIAPTISSEMDVAIKKSMKCVSMHSIKAKPKTKKGERLTPKEKEYYNKNEYNRWIDEAYLLMGRSYFYELNFDKAAETFTFVIREFPKEYSSYVAQIWMARVNCEKQEYRDAERTITQLETDKKFPKKLKLDLYATAAHVALKQGQFPQATKSLEKALPLVKHRKTKLRYLYILAQLYQESKQYEKSSEFYEMVIRKNPPYEMAFNAQINQASMVQAGSKSNKEIKQQLQKMLRDEKNKEYRDQIYYALGNIEMIEGNTDKAIEYYKESVTVSTQNNDQKALSCLTLADYYYSKKAYVPAQAYYDSTMLNIDQDYPKIDVIQVRAESLGHLVENLNTISREDSLQKIARLPESERNRIIDRIINDIRQKESQEQIAESQRLQDYYRTQTRQNMMPDQQASAKWYFYNPVSISQGMKEFQLKWGKRKLEDNWRRRNKSVSAFNEQPEENKAVEQSAESKIKDNKSREFYTQHIPFTDSAKRVSQTRLIRSYYDAGQVYRNDLKDLQPAIDLYETMLTKYPENEYKLPVYYQLYAMYNELKNPSKANYYKNILLTKYPDSNYAKVLNDPEFYKTFEAKEKEAERFYEQTYTQYEGGAYYQVISNADQASKNFTGNKILPKFALLKALAIGKTNTDVSAFRDELNRVIDTYPNNEVADYAKEVIAYLNTYKPESKQQEDIKKAEIIYAPTDSVFYFALVVSKTEDANQLVFDFINFNLDNFKNERLELNQNDMGKEYKILTVRPFANVKKATEYYNAFKSNPNNLKNVKSNTKDFFFITPANFEVLLKQPDASSYIEFFRLHYISKTNP